MDDSIMLHDYPGTDPFGTTASQQDQHTVGPHSHHSTVADQALIYSRLHNPKDALRILANASSVHSKRSPREPSRKECDWWWDKWAPVQQNKLSVEEAEALFAL